MASLQLSSFIMFWNQTSVELFHFLFYFIFLIGFSGSSQKLVFFAWEAVWGKVLILDQLQRRGWSLTNRCFLCLRHEESIDHLLLHCEMTWVL